MAVKGDIFDQLAAKSSENSSGDIFDKLAADQPSRARSLASAYPKGVLKGSQGLTPFMPRGPIPPELANKVFDQVLKTQPKDAERILERAGNLTSIAAQGGEGLALKAAQLGLGTLAGELAEENGLGPTGQSISELGAMAIPGLAKAGVQKATPLIKRGIEEATSLVKGPVEKMPSGLTKLRAVDAKNPQLGTLSKERQTAVIEKLDKEASDVAAKSIEKHQPIVKQIEDGFDFEGKFEKDFGEIQKLAEKANPEIDINPVSKLMKEEASKYRGIPELHADAKKITREISRFGVKPPVTMKNLLRTYRSNNKKIKHIYETSRLTGKQDDYVDFLVEYNRAIADSFKQTLPKDSAWIKLFEEANRDYKNYKDAQKTIFQLKEAIGEAPSPAKLEQLAGNVKKQERLSLSMGDKAAKEIIQIAQDLKQVKDIIKKIPQKEWGKFDAVFPIYYLIPFAGKLIGGGVTAIKAAKAGRYAYGWLLSTPARRKAYKTAVQAISKNDLDAYKKAVALLSRESTNQSDSK